MTVSELKRALESRGIDYRDCLEKRDLLNRLAQDVLEEERPTTQGGLTAPEKRLVSLFERCGPSVTFIQTSVTQKATLSLNPAEEMQAGTGSGFVWDDRGHIVTNFHVIKDGNRAKVKLSRGTDAYEATLVGAEPEKDLAVLRVQAPREKLRPIAVGSSADLLVGQSVVAIGNPFGLDNTLTTGVVSALGREVMGVGGRKIHGLVQTDAAINPGNSGGPLLDSSGRLIGVNTAIISPAGASVGIGFAIPVDTVRRVVNQIIRHGRVQRPTLGVQVADDQILRSLSKELGKELSGVLVMSVTASSPAARAGVVGTERSETGSLILGDIITKVAGVPTREVEDLLSAVEERRVGEIVDVVLLRGVGGEKQAKEVSLRLQLAERGQFAGSSGGQAKLPRPKQSARARL